MYDREKRQILRMTIFSFGYLNQTHPTRAASIHQVHSERGTSLSCPLFAKVILYRSTEKRDKERGRGGRERKKERGEKTQTCGTAERDQKLSRRPGPADLCVIFYPRRIPPPPPLARATRSMEQRGDIGTNFPPQKPRMENGGRGGRPGPGAKTYYILKWQKGDRA